MAHQNASFKCRNDLKVAEIDGEKLRNRHRTRQFRPILAVRPLCYAATTLKKFHAAHFRWSEVVHNLQINGLKLRLVLFSRIFEMLHPYL